MSINDKPLEPLMSVPTVANLFDVKPDTVRDWIKSGKLKATKLNGKWRVSRSEVIRLGNSQYGA